MKINLNLFFVVVPSSIKLLEPDLRVCSQIVRIEPKSMRNTLSFVAHFFFLFFFFVLASGLTSQGE